MRRSAHGDDLFMTEGENVSSPLHGSRLMEPSLLASVVEGHEGDHREPVIGCGFFEALSFSRGRAASRTRFVDCPSVLAHLGQSVYG